MHASCMPLSSSLFAMGTALIEPLTFKTYMADPNIQA